MWPVLTRVAFRVLGPFVVVARPSLQPTRFGLLRLMESHGTPAGNPTYVTSAQPNRRSVSCFL